jgi:hypothetical protein
MCFSWSTPTFFSGKIWKNPHPLLHVLHLQRHRFAIEGISPTQHDEEHRTQAAAREAADGSDIWGIEPPTIEIIEYIPGTILDIICFFLMSSSIFYPYHVHL